LYNTIAYGVRVMPAYGHQVKVQDRWAIVAYLRVLQYAAGNPAFDKK
jgi:mono/diheme cytochrome c family protein